jgi:hypothetical protein
MTTAQLEPSTLPLPDLVAQTLNITAYYATNLVTVSAVVANTGLANISGPFTISIAVTLYNNGVTTEYAETFQVPNGVTLYGRPPLEHAAVVEHLLVHNPRTTQYTTPIMEVPLQLDQNNGPLTAYYEAEFSVDTGIAEASKANNTYGPEKFWFTTSSLEAPEKMGPTLMRSHMVA